MKKRGKFKVGIIFDWMELFLHCLCSSKKWEIFPTKMDHLSIFLQIRFLFWLQYYQQLKKYFLHQIIEVAGGVRWYGMIFGYRLRQYHKWKIVHKTEVIWFFEGTLFPKKKPFLLLLEQNLFNHSHKNFKVSSEIDFWEQKNWKWDMERFGRDLAEMLWFRQTIRFQT